MDSPSPVGGGRSAPTSSRGGRGSRQGGERRGKNSGRSGSSKGRGDDKSRNGNYPAATLPRKPGGDRNDRKLRHISAEDDGVLERDGGGDGDFAHVRIEDEIGMMSDQVSSVSCPRAVVIAMIFFWHAQLFCLFASFCAQ